jgi:hypothetical protein
MGVIIKYLKEYYSRDFSWPYFFLVVLMLTVLIYFNYWHQLERKYAVGDGTWSRGFMGYYLMYLLPFVCAFALQLLFFKNTDYIKNPWFWVILLLAPAFFSFRVNFDFHEALIKERWQMPERVFYLLSLNYIVRVFVLLLPVFICWLIKDRQVQPFYGTQALTNVKPYLLMLLVMLPLITLASTQKDFLQTYPKAQLLAAIPSQGWAGKLRYIVYELCYGFDFVSIEFFFRGFLILALMRICGTHCIIPVACFYCTIHLGKPMGEAISSFWGGMLLGIVSYNTGSVWGGLVVHLGIAWMMELGGWLGHVFKRG